MSLDFSQIPIDSVLGFYKDCKVGEGSNTDLYSYLSEKLEIPEADFNKTISIGKENEEHSPLKRKVRWYQQTLKQLGVIENIGRGKWKLTEQKNDLNFCLPNMALVGFESELGIALWANASALEGLNETVHLCFTSPPYPLKTPRSYGNVEEKKWIEFICTTLTPIVKNLVDGGSIVLNISNDIFLSKSPARSLYMERLILTLSDEMGLYLMDRIPWVNKCKPPSPTYWACVKPFQLKVTWEPLLWFTNNPDKVRSNNRNVLEPHTEQHKKFVASGGVKKNAVYGDGAYHKRVGASYQNKTEGSLPRNIIELSHNCADTRKVREYAKTRGIKPHPAMFPTALADFFIKFLTNEHELVVDPFAGSFKTCLAAEKNNRRWLGTEQVLEFVMQGASLFKSNNIVATW